jgi:hypothetical protein
VPTPQDSYPTRSLDNNALSQPESRQTFARLLAQGWTDAMRRLGSRSPLRCESLPEAFPIKASDYSGVANVCATTRESQVSYQSISQQMEKSH